MKKIIIITGLPGSGKTTLSQQYALKGYHLVDDLSISINNDFSKLKPFLQELNHYEEIVLNDCHLCVAQNQEVFLKLLDEVLPEHQQKWIFFDNNKEHAMSNMLGRNTHKADITIRNLSKLYSISPEIKPVIKKTKKYF